ncbi:MAG TPA: hypothetical protein VM533_09990 [Fimbriiglobus sp.]|jgi:hypothetical protein|nr:hypothetical protein [Fimbriiglobus sp.]
MTEPDLSPLARRLLEKHWEADGSGAGNRGIRKAVPGHTPEEHTAAYAELVRAGYVRLGTVAFAGDATVQYYDLTEKARRLRG